MSLIGSLFGRSPIRPMQEHMRAAVACAQEVIPFVEAMTVGDSGAMAAHRETIVRLEHEADAIKNARFVTNPGCFATGAIAILRPLVEAGIIAVNESHTIFGVSGYSGGGKSLIELWEAPDGGRGGSGQEHLPHCGGL